MLNPLKLRDSHRGGIRTRIFGVDEVTVVFTTGESRRSYSEGTISNSSCYSSGSSFDANPIRRLMSFVRMIHAIDSMSALLGIRLSL